MKLDLKVALFALFIFFVIFTTIFYLDIGPLSLAVGNLLKYVSIILSETFFLLIKMI